MFVKMLKFFILSTLVCSNLSAIHYDYIIVGNGSAGAILARKLSDNFKKSVLVLEVGTNHNNDPVILDPNIFTDDDIANLLTIDPKYAVTYPIELFQPLQFAIYSEGRGWGGGGMHNYLLAVRPVPSDTAVWSATSNNVRWDYANLFPYMLALEHFYPNGIVADFTQRGDAGPISITQTPPIAADPFTIAAVAATGTTFIPDYNNALDPLLGFSAIQSFVTPEPNSHRSFSGLEFLTPNVVTPNGQGVGGRKLTIISDAYVSRVKFEGKNNPKAVGVEFIYADQKEKVYEACADQIIMCAGSINTPAILQRSGIGDAVLLQSLGIDVVVNNPNVGANLINQYGSSAIIAGATTTVSAVGFLNGQPYLPAEPIRKLQLIPQDIGPGLMQIVGFILHPNSRGSVNIVSKNPFNQPRVKLNMFSDGGVTDPNSDASAIVAFFKIARDIATAAGGVVVYPPAADFGSDQALLMDAENKIAIEDHACGTARMGTSIANGVVDGNLRVFGVRNFVIADMSVIPYESSGNTCLTAYLVGLVEAAIQGVPTPPAL